MNAQIRLVEKGGHVVSASATVPGSGKPAHDIPYDEKKYYAILRRLMGDANATRTSLTYEIVCDGKYLGTAGILMSRSKTVPGKIDYHYVGVLSVLFRLAGSRWLSFLYQYVTSDVYRRESMRLCAEMFWQQFPQEWINGVSEARPEREVHDQVP